MGTDKTVITNYRVMPYMVPLHKTVLFPILTYGWIVLSSKMKTFSPISAESLTLAEG